jgi:hypothetical protein
MLRMGSLEGEGRREGEGGFRPVHFFFLMSWGGRREREREREREEGEGEEGRS